MSESTESRRRRPHNRLVEPPDPFPQVLAAAQGGDPEACAYLWRRYAPRVATYARARGSLEPDDLTSEVFLAVFRKLHDFTGGEGAFRGYVFTVAHRRLVDELRARARHGTQASWTEDGDPRQVVSAEERALEAVGSARAREMLEALAPDQRDVLVLRIFADLTVDQVAEILGKQPGAVKALQRRGMAALRRKFIDTRTPVSATVDRNQ